MTFEDGKLISEAYVDVNGVKYPVVMPVYEGKTPLSAAILNKLQKELKFGINSTSVTDCNNATSFGIYMISPNCLNCPSDVDPTATQLDGNICYLIVLTLENIEPTIQLFIDSKTHVVYMRKSKGYYSGFEENWLKISKSETILFENSSGSADSFYTLTETYKKYKELDIDYRTTGGYCGRLTIPTSLMYDSCKATISVPFLDYDDSDNELPTTYYKELRFIDTSVYITDWKISNNEFDYASGKILIFKITGRN